MKNKLMILTEEQYEFFSEVKKLNLLDLEIIVPRNEKEILDNIKDVTIILANPLITKKYINMAEKVVWVQSTFAGIDALVSKECKSDYILTNVKGTYGKEMSEYVFGYILMLEKEVLKNLKFQSEKKWSHRAQPSIQNKVLAIMGVGSIGKEIARVGKIFGMEVIGLRTIDEPVEYIDEVYTEDNIKKFLSKADYLVLVLPNTVSTKNMINEETLSYMKKTSVLINVGRGNSINEDDLIQALNNKKISFAVLDVFKEEPLSKENPLWNLDNIIITPHISGYIVDITKIIKVFGDNYKKFINGEKVDYRIDFKKGY